MKVQNYLLISKVSEKREAKIGVLERCQKSVLVIVRRGWWGVAS